MTVKFADVKQDLCESCRFAKKNVCPVWPTLKMVTKCVEYKKKI